MKKKKILSLLALSFWSNYFICFEAFSADQESSSRLPIYAMMSPNLRKTMNELDKLHANTLKKILDICPQVFSSPEVKAQLKLMDSIPMQETLDKFGALVNQCHQTAYILEDGVKTLRTHLESLESNDWMGPFVRLSAFQILIYESYLEPISRLKVQTKHLNIKGLLDIYIRKLWLHTVEEKKNMYRKSEVARTRLLSDEERNSL